MRLSIVTAAMLTALLGGAPAHAAWKTYTYKDEQVIKDFPGEPKRETGVYKTPLAREAPQVVYSVVKDGNTYRLTVVDFHARPGDGANLMMEAAAREVQGKGVTFSVDDFPLYDKGANSVYGANLRIRKPDGGRELAVNFFNKGRLYIIEAVVPKDSQDDASPDISRFMEAVIFHMQGYGFDFNTGHDFPLGDDDPNDRDTRVIPGYKPPPGYENAGQKPAAN